ncbi:hypothetical protein CTheo_6072 [Ceratobasidium theobromae]|uniref:Uncharacterized protein n=1 Tax=Ceratobasidium theobromae TaxID=1582974 RepID=A0A5N5QFH6_9AGAM|nr:hypothetical protein CTheo_6072 [Ceratobasidium theobromae]
MTSYTRDFEVVGDVTLSDTDQPEELWLLISLSFRVYRSRVKPRKGHWVVLLTQRSQYDDTERYLRIIPRLSQDNKLSEIISRFVEDPDRDHQGFAEDAIDMRVRWSDTSKPDNLDLRDLYHSDLAEILFSPKLGFQAPMTLEGGGSFQFCLKLADILAEKRIITGLQRGWLNQRAQMIERIYGFGRFADWSVRS